MRSPGDGNARADNGARLVNDIGTRLEAISVWLRKLDPEATFDARDRQLLSEAVADLHAFRAGQVLSNEGDGVGTAVLIVRGIACRSKETLGGRRQIIAICLPGDLSEPGGAALEKTDYSVQALTAGCAALVAARSLRGLEKRESIAFALRRAEARDNAISREWILNLAARPAKERIAHLLCELVSRLRQVGLVRGNACEFPLSQQVLAEATGLSAVHVNRILQDLRAAGLIRLQAGKLEFPDPLRLEALAEFSPLV